MFKTFVFLFVLGANSPTTIEDELGPYDTLERCFFRGANIVRSLYSTEFPIIKVEVVCVELKIEKKEKKPSERKNLMI